MDYTLNECLKNADKVLNELAIHFLANISGDDKINDIVPLIEQQVKLSDILMTLIDIGKR